jgi:hypothetical protein
MTRFEVSQRKFKPIYYLLNLNGKSDPFQANHSTESSTLMASRTHVKDSPFKRATLPQGSIKNTLSFYAYSPGERSFGYAFSDQE